MSGLWTRASLTRVVLEVKQNSAWCENRLTDTVRPTPASKDFEMAMRACGHKVELTADLHAEIRKALHYDKRKNGSHGRALLKDIPAANLCAGDRLESSENLRDAGQFETLSAFPCEVVFWRPSDSTLALFRCPLWCPEIGIDPATSPAIDFLHSYYIGVLHVWAKHALWALLRAPIWGVGQPTEQERLLVALLAMKVELWEHYTRYDREHPTERCTRLADLTPKMVGIGSEMKLRTKAKETFHVALYLLEALERNLDRLGAEGPVYLESGRLCVGLVQRLKELPAVPSVGQSGEVLDMWKSYMRVVEPLWLYTPKAHLMYHLIQRMPFQGNPVTYQTFVDESLNRILKRVVRLVHQANFEPLAMCKLHEALSRTAVRQRLS